ncbi:predicted protein [Histoplasma mississippiense (nom. inval.)]|uniref:predicted protein n=1 Tax=Ajellomyces capsulatus (strain NAm1 / WU24) TaxID=2059318 RepID=UPI000157B98D|nr:predicted protein [Histoplasma mississippiense (nom. inval.)]EDN03589.1 predicted protein [Histoplasma mississippiense (nom. inval.)]
MEQEFTHLHVKDGDYLAYVRRYQYLSARMRQLTEDRGENYLHDFFIIGLRDYQRTYVKSRLDTFYGTGQGPIVNLDINDLTKQIAHRMSKSEGTGRPKAPKANAATNDNDNTTSAATAKCGYCKVPGHIKANCYHLNPDKAPEWWRKENKDNKGTDNTEGAKKKGKDKKKDKDDDKPTGTRAPDLLASQPNANAAIALSTSSATTSKPWYLDTCASFNMTGERHSLVRAKSFEGDLEITTADGGVGRVEEIGDILLESEGGDISVGYVHWIPNLTVNLLSFAKLEDQGFRYQLSDTTPSYFTIRAPNGANFTAVRTSKESVYKIIERESQIDVHHPSQAVHFMAKSYNYGDAMSTIAGKPNDQPSDRNPLTRTLMEWHVTLGHIHAGAIIALAKDPSSGIRIKGSKTGFFCDSCVKAGMTRKFSQTPMPRALRAMQRVHIDLAGGGRTLDDMSDYPIESRQGTKYYMLITDDATRYRWIYFLHTKDQAVEIYAHWVQFMKNLGFTPPALVRTDIDGVFRSNKMTTMMTKDGTIWEPTTPQSPHQDGVSERGIRTIMTRARAVLLGMNIPKKFWADVLETVVAITNNTPTSTTLYNEKYWPTNNADEAPARCPYTVPFSALTNAPPQLRHFRELGVDVYAHLHGSQKPTDKLSARAEIFKLIGFRGNSIYRLWSPTTDKIIVTSDVVFPAKEPTTSQDDTNHTTPEPASPATYLVDDTTVPELADAEWVRPAKAFATYVPSPLTGSVPKGYKDAVSRPGGVGEYWQKSMEREIADLERRNTWTMIPRSDVPSAAKRGWTLRQVDIVMAYLHGRLGKTIYMRQPTGFEVGTPHAMVCAVGGSLYGLDPAAKIWYDFLTALLRENGFKPSPYDPALWRHTSRNHLYMTIYVDDLHIIAEDPADADWLVDTLANKLEIKDLKEPSKYLGMEVERRPDGAIKLTLRRYIDRLVQDFRLDDAVPVPTPILEGLKIDDTPVSEREGGFTKKRYQHGVGCLQYLAVKLRPDIARAASLLAQKNTAPTPKAWRALLRVIQYLKGTSDLGILYEGHKNEIDEFPNASYLPIGYTDSDWAGPLNGERKSTSGFIFKLAGAPISWRSSKQPCVSLSSNEAEYVALSEAVREATWLRNMMMELGFVTAKDPLPIRADNKGSIDLATVAAITARSKHIDTRFHYSRTQLNEGVISIKHVPTEDMVADGLTKPLGTVAFRRFIDLLGLFAGNSEND